MMGRSFARIGLLVVAFGAGTYGFGWWAVPVIGLAWGAMSPGAFRAALRAGLAAAVAWGLLLVLPGALRAPVFSFGANLASSMGLPVWALYLAELLFPLAAAWSAALIGSAVRGAGARGDTTQPAQ